MYDIWVTHKFSNLAKTRVTCCSVLLKDSVN